MKKCITDYLDVTLSKWPKKIVFGEKDKAITYEEFVIKAKILATRILLLNLYNKPIIIFTDKSINTLVGMFGVLYSANYYTVVDRNMPENRIKSIVGTLGVKLALVDDASSSLFDELNLGIDKILIDEVSEKIDDELIRKAHDRLININPAYVLFTSGSTGEPKGSVISHRSLIDYVSWFSETFNIDENVIFGSQTPFYFSMSVSDVFSTVYNGASLYIIPKSYFSFPMKLVEFLDEKMINTIYWVPSAMAIVANLKTFDVIVPKTLKKVLFAGEVMPMRVLNTWRKAMPDLFYANLYGPTELTDICTYYVVNRDFKDDEVLPIGRVCDNAEAIILDENNKEALEGELCIKGSIMGFGYFNNKEKTNSTFILNPVNDSYIEYIYKTGDIVKYNEYGELIYLSRKDFQIKHMGYRIELGEIEANINAFDKIDLCACIYVNEKIILYYQGNTSIEDVHKYANEKLVSYMRPQIVKKLQRMPINANGKIDRTKLKEMFEEE